MISLSPSWQVTSFATKPVLNSTGFFDAHPDPARLSGEPTRCGRHPKQKGRTDIYYLGLNKKQAVFERGAGREVRHTIGTRFWRKPGGWDYNSEAMIQLGTFGSGGLRAWGTGHDSHLSLSAAYDHFFAGRFLISAAPPRRWVDHAAVWATYRS